MYLGEEITVSHKYPDSLDEFDIFQKLSERYVIYPVIKITNVHMHRVTHRICTADLQAIKCILLKILWRLTAAILHFHTQGPVKVGVSLARILLNHLTTHMDSLPNSLLLDDDLLFTIQKLAMATEMAHLCRLRQKCGIPITFEEEVELQLQADDERRVQYGQAAARLHLEHEVLLGILFPSLIEALLLMTRHIQSRERHLVSVMTRGFLDIKGRDSQGRTALHLAAAFTSDQCVIDFLLQTDIPIDSTDRFGRTPLHVAVEAEVREFVRLLLEAKASPDGVDLETRDIATECILTR